MERKKYLEVALKEAVEKYLYFFEVPTDFFEISCNKFRVTLEIRDRY